MGLNTRSFTMKESLLVLDEALHLLRSPERWVRGAWKCPVWELSPSGFKTSHQKRDKDGSPMFAYCIEGAVNQAVINKFGPVRAAALGALRPEACEIPGREFTNGDLDTGQDGPTDLLSVNDIVRELYADEVDIPIDRSAMYLNDNNSIAKEAGYRMIITALRTKRDRIAAAIAAKFKS